MRVNIEGSLNNLTQNQKEKIVASAIYQKDKLTFLNDGVKYCLKMTPNTIYLERENALFKNILTFQLNQITENEYLLKENDSFFLINIKTLFLERSERQIKIIYEVIDSNEVFEYIIEIR